MKAVIKPSRLSGTALAPASKSSMQRACAAALIAKGKTVIDNPGHSNDDKAAIEMIQRLGADVVESNGKLVITSNGVKPKTGEVNCGESGLGIRMFTPIIALASDEVLINGEGSLLKRPMDFFDEILPSLGVTVRSNNGQLPIKVKGPLRPANIQIDGSLSSQFLTGLLLAYAASDATSVTITVNNLSSRPYIDLTLAVLKQFGLKRPDNNNYESFTFGPSSKGDVPASRNYTVEGDWSGGAFLLVAGTIAGPITIKGLDMSSTQADKAIMQALGDARASFAIEAKGIKVRPTAMRGFNFDATDCPDLFPPLVALAANCKGVTNIKGVGRLTHKESNRTLSLKEEFGKMGVRIEVNQDEMVVHGTAQIQGANVHSRHDHRIAMACAIAALAGSGQTEIEDADAVKKSYPDFYDDIKALGADVSLSTAIKYHE